MAFANFETRIQFSAIRAVIALLVTIATSSIAQICMAQEPRTQMLQVSLRDPVPLPNYLPPKPLLQESPQPTSEDDSPNVFLQPLALEPISPPPGEATDDFDSLEAALEAMDFSEPEPPKPLVRYISVPLANCPVLKPGDEVYEISTRGLPSLPRCTTMSPVDYQVTKLESTGWRSISCEEFYSNLLAAPHLRTVIYTHGNWMEAGNARNRGTYVYQRLSQRAGEPIRTIMYSWPSQRDGRPIRDVLEKAARADVDTYYFAFLLGKIPNTTPLGVLGFSFGSRVVCGGLHIANGGTFEGRTLANIPPRDNVRVSLVAPAFDRTWLVANRPYGLAIRNVDCLVNVYNSRDPVLRRFRFIDAVTDPIAAGFSGIADPRATQPLQSDAKIRQYDCSGAVGSSHDEMTYYLQCGHYNTAIDNVLGK